MANLFGLQQQKCKTCGEPLDLSKAINGVVKCAICDSVFTLPKVDASQKVLDFLSQGEHDLDTCRFEDAYSAFNKACELDKTEPEAYWGMALAEFKIQYLKDEVNNRLQPICHEISDKDFADSSNFLRATRYATEAQRVEYERKAEEINYIKNEFNKIAKTGAKYDCFICVKVTDENGGKTQDYKAADDIYFELKGKGYKPFFSERELRGVTGADYEARILYALQSAECMLVICFDEAYLRTKWVKNEYSRFLKLVNDEEKESDSIALVFGNRPVEKLPGKKGKIQGIALNSLTAMERIVQFVDSHTPEARKRREEALRAKEEEAKKKAKEDDALKQKLAEQENLIRQLQEQMQSQVAQIQNAQAHPSGGLSDDELLERMERARQERERREREEAERKAREERARKERERKEAEERVRIQAELERQERERQEREKKEAEAKARAERERLERERKEAEESARLQAERERQESARIARDFEIVDGVIRKYKGADKDVVIPDGVKKIGGESFKGCAKIEKITIPNSVTAIGVYAFQNCSGLKSINISNGVTKIENGAFWWCSELKDIVIPSSVTEIDGWVFNTCKGLESLTVEAGNPNYKSENNCILTKDGATLLYGCKNSVIPESVKFIDRSAFYGCKQLTEINIPDSVTTIGDEAFAESGLTSIEIPNSVTRIGGSAFRGCGNLHNLKIPDSVKDIGFMAFLNCNKFTEIVIPNGVTSIDSFAFKSCTKLQKVVIPESVTKMGEGVFSKWYSEYNHNAELTIYCRANKQPKGWDKNWNKKADNKIIAGKHKVVWGYKGN